MIGENPFPGLRPFEPEESYLFFGREGATDDLLRKLRNSRLIAVVGTSGSGKSSLVRAGVLPDLYGGFMAEAGSHWRVAIMRPGEAPISALAQALSGADIFGREDQPSTMQRAITETVLRRGALGLVDVTRQARLPSGDNLLVLVDQFEELFRLQPSLTGRGAKDESAAFVKLLLEAAKQTDLPIYVMLTMRSEYLGDCTRFRNLPEAINAGQYLIPRMTRDQGRKAITGPIAVAGGSISAPLVQRLLNDVGDNPDQLPIMQHAMMRTWSLWEDEGREDAEIGLSHYQATGGMGDALSRHADETYDGLPDGPTRAAATRIFKRLTGRGSGNREMRYPATVAELCAVSEAPRECVLEVIEAFRRADRSLLMPPAGVPLSDDTLIDISHESLIRIWKRLRQWVEEESQSARIYTRLAETSALHGRREAGLWRDPDLQIALNWRQLSRPNYAWSQRYQGGFDKAMGFLDASRSAALRRKAMILVPAVLLPLAGAVYVVNQSVTARLEAVTARVAVEERLAVVKEEKAEFQTALENVKEQADSEQELVEQATEQANKFSELKSTTEDFQAMEDSLQAEIELQLTLLETAVSSDASGAESEQIQRTLLNLSQRAAAVQELGRQSKERIESEIVETAEQLAVVSAEGAKLDSGQGSVSGVNGPESDRREDPVEVQRVEVAAVEVRVKPVEALDKAPPLGPEASAPQPSSAGIVEGDAVEAPTKVANAGAVSEPLTTTNESGDPEACREARQAQGRIPIGALLDKWRACGEVAASGPLGTEAEAHIAALERDLSSYASIAAPKDFLTCADVESLECVSANDAFDRGKVYVFARVRAPQDAELTLKWFRQDGSEYRSGKLKVRQNTERGFRAFTWRNVVEPGDYFVSLYNEVDAVIGRRAFEVR